MKYADIPGNARSSAGFTQHGKYLYWAAGHMGEFHIYEKENFSREFHRLDLETGTWEELQNFPVLAQGFRMTTHNGKIYAFGGFVHEGDGEWPVRSTNIVRCYDPVTNKWENVAQLDSPRSSNVLGKVGSLVYLIGGWNGFDKKIAAEDGTTKWISKPGTFLDTIEVFDMDLLKTISVLPLGISPRRAFSAVTNGRDITIACGMGPQGGSDLFSDVMTYSTLSGKWVKLFDTPQPRFATGIAWPTHSPIIVGGLFIGNNGKAEEFDNLGTMDPHANGGWKTRALSSTRTFAETAIWDNQLIVLGGHSGKLPVSTVEVFELDSLWGN